MKLIVCLCNIWIYISTINCFYIRIIKHLHLYTITFQTTQSWFNFSPINCIIFSNFILWYIQDCLIYLWSSNTILSTELSFTLSWGWWISSHITIISNISHTIIIWFLIPHRSPITNIIKIFIISSFKAIPKSLTICLSHPDRSLNTIFTIRGIQKSWYFITWYWFFLRERCNIYSHFF